MSAKADLTSSICSPAEFREKKATIAPFFSKEDTNVINYQQ
jgi:hypothetical protein